MPLPCPYRRVRGRAMRSRALNLNFRGPSAEDSMLLPVDAIEIGGFETLLSSQKIAVFATQ